MKRLRNRIAFEAREWKRCRAYHAGNARHADPKAGEVRRGAFAVQRTALPRPVILALWMTALFIMYVLAFGGVL